jgi:hypothetical protein
MSNLKLAVKPTVAHESLEGVMYGSSGMMTTELA